MKTTPETDFSLSRRKMLIKSNTWIFSRHSAENDGRDERFAASRRRDNDRVVGQSLQVKLSSCK